MLQARVLSVAGKNRRGIGMIQHSRHQTTRHYQWTNNNKTFADIRRNAVARGARFNQTQYSTVFPLIVMGGLAFSRKSITLCQSVLHQQNFQATSTSSHNISVTDLILPSLQALLRALRLLQTTGLIVLDYELYKWQQKATKFVNNFTEDWTWFSKSQLSSSLSTSASRTSALTTSGKT